MCRSVLHRYSGRRTQTQVAGDVSFAISREHTSGARRNLRGADDGHADSARSFHSVDPCREILGIDTDFCAKAVAVRARLAPMQIGKAGQFQEWLEDWDLEAPERQHRHVSHLYGLFPSDQITFANRRSFSLLPEKLWNCEAMSVPAGVWHGKLTSGPDY